MIKKVIIIGGGLTGLSLAYFLKKRNIEFQILEARDRFGGRINTIKGKEGTPIEMGATWLGNKHTHLVDFLNEINVEIFQQYNHGISFFETMSFAPPQQFEIPKSEEPSYRIKGGTSTLISTLVNLVGEENISLDQQIVKIEKQDKSILLKTNTQKEFSAELVISTLPPKLFINLITCLPSLTSQEIQICKTTQTWMEGSIKFAVEFSTPFWKEKGYSGMVFSQSSIIPEMYDHTNFEENKFALKGFLNGSIANYSKEQRESKVIATLKKFFGKEVEDYVGYFDNIWEKEPFTFSASADYIFPHQNNGHEIFQKGFWGNKLWLAGTETSPNFGGYMEGALQSAKNVSEQILNEIK